MLKRNSPQRTGGNAKGTEQNDNSLEEVMAFAGLQAIQKKEDIGVQRSMNTTPFNIYPPNTNGIGLYLNVVPEVKEGYTQFQVFLDDDNITVLSKNETGEWEWIGGEYPGEVDFGFIVGQIESNILKGVSSSRYQVSGLGGVGGKISAKRLAVYPLKMDQSLTYLLLILILDT